VGGNSFKFILQVANLEKPNPKHNTHLLLIANCSDKRSNLKTLLEDYSEQAAQLQQMEWRGKKIRVFLFGDFEFQWKMYGHVGAASTFPCLWCHITMDEKNKKKRQTAQACAKKSPKRKGGCLLFPTGTATSQV
jgi:hypothetical protein